MVQRNGVMQVLMQHADVRGCEQLTFICWIYKNIIWLVKYENVNYLESP